MNIRKIIDSEIGKLYEGLINSVDDDGVTYYAPGTNPDNEEDLIDPNGGNTYYPPGLNPEVVKLFEDGGILDETYQSINELKELTNNILKTIADKNYIRINKNGFDILYGIHLNSEIDYRKYSEIGNFIKETNLYINLEPVSDDTAKYRSVYNPNGGDYKASNETSIDVTYDYSEMKEKVDNSLKMDGQLTSNKLYSLIYDKLFSPMLHELQHAYDDYRSKGKIFKDKQTLKYDKKYSVSLPNADQQEFKSYLNLPSEIWARFSQAIVDTKFYTLKFIDNDTIKYEMIPVKDVVKTFFKTFKGRTILSPTMKKKLLNKIVQFWYFEKEKIDKMNQKQ